MLVNPGGPGGSGLGLARLGAFVPEQRRRPDYDWIGFDPRGVGSSQPSLSCDGEYFGGYNRPYYVPETAALRAGVVGQDPAVRPRLRRRRRRPARPHEDDRHGRPTWRASARRSAPARSTTTASPTAPTSARSTARCTPTRSAGWSGTASSTRVDVWYDANLNQDIQFDKNMEIYFDWVAKHDDVYHLGTTAPPSRTNTTPSCSSCAGTRSARSARTSGTTFRRGGLLRLRLGGRRPGVRGRRDTATSARPATPTATRPVLARTTTMPITWRSSAPTCSGRTSWAKWQQDNWGIYTRVPFMTWNNAWYNAPCRYWPARRGHAGQRQRYEGPARSC